MKKRLTFCGVLCLALALFCGTALAADAQVTPTNPETVQVEKVDKGEDVAFKVTKTSGVQEGQLYLIMIQEGDDATAKPKPTKDNLYYLNVEPASAFPLEAYPKDLKADSSYVVYLSDYSAGSDGAAQGVALISTKESPIPTPKTYTVTFDANGGSGSMAAQAFTEPNLTANLSANAFTYDGNTFDGWNTAKDGSGDAYADKASFTASADVTLYAQWKTTTPTPGDDTPSGGDTSGVKKGDVNGDGKVNSSDISALVNLIISGKEPTEAQKTSADVNGDGKVNSSDISALVNLIIRG